MKKAILTATALVAGLGMFSLRGRANHPGMEALRGWGYAHRGLHCEGRPENSLAAFRAAVEKGYGSELDVHLMKDGNLAVIHDASLMRTAGADVKIEDLTLEDLENYRLEGTGEKIPLLSQVLEIYAGKAPLIIELKPVENHAALSQAVCDLLESYEGPYCLESFDPRCIHWLKQNRPQLIRGQLTENFVANDKKMPLVLRFVLTHNLLNFTTCPDFVAYKFADRKHTVTNALCRKVWDLQGVSWTIKSQEDYDTAVKDGWLPIFEGFEP